MSTPKRPRIFVVEDSPTQALLLQHLLADKGYRVDSFPDGASCLEGVGKRRPDLIVSDIVMPDMDGYQLCALLKADPGLREIPVLLLTTLTQGESILRGLEVGADGYVTKPFEEPLLLAQVHSLLKDRGSGEGPEPTIELDHGGRRYRISAGRRRILETLIWTYENVLDHNRRLGETREKLEELNQELTGNLAELQSSEERFRSLVMTVPDIVYRVDPDGRFTFLNNAVRALGHDPEELIGRHFSELVLPADLESVSREQVLPGYAGKRTGDEGAPKLFDERRGGERLTRGLEVRLLVKHGQSPREGRVEPLGEDTAIVEINSSGVYGPAGDSGARVFVGSVGVIRDISEHKRLTRELHEAYEGLEVKVQERTADLLALNRTLEGQIEERKRMEEELRSLVEQIRRSQIKLIQAEKMSALGTLVAGMAHELNNPTMSILNFVQYCRNKTAAEDPRYGVLRDTEHEVQRCIRIVQDLLTFAHQEPESAAMTPKDLDPVMRRILALLSYRIERENVCVDYRAPAEDLIFPMREDRIQQLLLNLLANALDSLRDRPDKRIQITARRDDSWVEVHVTDSGCGIAPEHLDKVFDPFFTTKNVGEGTGLGLSVGQAIAREHGGEIRFESEAGRGTTATLRLPAPARASGQRAPVEEGDG